jgi:hypothetical protein
LANAGEALSVAEGLVGGVEDRNEGEDDFFVVPVESVEDVRDHGEGEYWGVEGSEHEGFERGEGECKREIRIWADVVEWLFLQ